jgi:hypothetical protein
MKQRALSSFLFLLFIPVVTVALCTGDLSIAAEAKRSTVIFVGTVVKIERGQQATPAISFGSGKTWEKYLKDVDIIHFEVAEAFKPVKIKTISVVKDADSFVGISGTWFRVGGSYLIYASAVPRSLGRRRQGAPTVSRKLSREIDSFNRKLPPYQTGLCTRTVPAKLADQEIAELRKMFGRSVRGSNR